MSKPWLCFLIVVGLLAGSGCGSSSGPQEQPAEPVETRASLSDHTDISLANLLTRPRAELAVMAEDLLAQDRVRQKARRDGKEVFLLLPDLHLPLAVPVLREAKFSGKAGFSLPPYLKEGTTDSAVALHLARFGDAVAARRLADPADAAVDKQIEAYACERNYPLEWTRLVGVLLHSAQYRLATGDLDGASELVQLHKQLNEVLDKKAARGPLGACLLPRGRQVLGMAAEAWRMEKQTLLAEQTREALASWGEAPPPPVLIPLGSSRTEVGRLLPGAGQGRMVPALSTERALDLFALPIPDHGVLAVLSAFDATDRFIEVLAVYRAKIGESYPLPADLAFLLHEHDPPAEAGGQGRDNGSHGLRRTTYPIGAVRCEVTLITRNDAAGALVQVHAGKQGETAPQLQRDLGIVHLDRTFEQNRLRLTPDQRADTLTTERPEKLAQLHNPLPLLHPAAVILQRESSHDLLNKLTVRYRVEQSPSLAQLGLPLWAAYGAGHFEGIDDEQGGHLVCRWADGRTSCTLRLPHVSTEPVELEVADQQPASEVARRAADAVAFDQAERKARFLEGKLLTRLPRSLEVNAIQLGMSRDAVEQALPGGKRVFVRNAGDAIVVTLGGEPERNVRLIARQLYLRFDTANRLVEVRVRYEELSSSGAAGLKALVAGLKKKGGVPLELPAPWASLWSDLPARKPAASCYRWQDDTTLLTYQADSGGAEIAVRDCPQDQPAGASLPPLEYLPRGPEGCRLGEERTELLKRWGITQPATVAGGATVLNPAKAEQYDALLVWFDKGLVARIVARHVQPATATPQPAQLASALMEGWGRDITTLGWPRRQDMTSAEVLQSLGWHDERTRMRLFWEEPDHGPARQYTEWKQVQ